MTIPSGSKVFCDGATALQGEKRTPEEQKELEKAIRCAEERFRRDQEEEARQRA